jgi:hypothetical protein
MYKKKIISGDFNGRTEQRRELHKTFELGHML